MSLKNVALRAATLDDLTGIAAIYNQLWCNTLRNRGDVEAADFCARFNIAMQLQRSPIALVAEAEGRIIAACCIGIFEDGKPRTTFTAISASTWPIPTTTARAKGWMPSIRRRRLIPRCRTFFSPRRCCPVPERLISTS